MKFGFNKAELVQDLNTGLWYRKDSKIDKITLNFGSKDYCRGPGEYYRIIKFCRDCVIMDIGANIGYFTYWAFFNGAKQVECYEPDSENFEILEKNVVNKFSAVCHQAAISNKTEEKLFFIKEFDSNTLDESSKGHYKATKTVKTLSFTDELERIKPNFIKCDIEGGEYALDWNLPNYVKYLAIEIHHKHHEEDADKLLKLLSSQFETIKLRETTFVGKKYTTVFMGKK